MTLSAYDGLIISLGSLVFGLFLLLRSSDALVGSASFVARRLGLSEFFIAATVVAFGTSAPELFISVNANLGGSPGVAIGNVVGSNTVNVLVILGVTALIFPLAFRQTMLLRDVSVMVLSSAWLSALVAWGSFGLWSGVAMLVTLAAYVSWQFFEDVPDREAPGVPDQREEGVGRHLATMLACLAGLVIGTEFLVKGAVSAGLGLGIPETFVALTVVAVGTALPEMTTSFLAALRGKGDMVIGNILGSNIFNVLAIMGVTSAIAPVASANTVGVFDLAVFVGSAVALLAAVWLKGMPRWAGALMVAAYAGYVAIQYLVI